jgi:hypothetical protein
MPCRIADIARFDDRDPPAGLFGRAGGRLTGIAGAQNDEIVVVSHHQNDAASPASGYTRGMQLWLTVLAVAAALVVPGCQKGENKPPRAEPAAAERSAAAAPAATGGDIGIAICDRYLASGDQCIEKMPEKMRAAERQRLSRVRADWQRQAARPGARQRLEKRCDELYRAALTVADRFCPGVY